ncbi:type IV pilus twitching motility protein PilT [Dactylococcopsis salina]|uniref:Pilus retraction protein PilT n=1 Tax=Dactylococcopsis salina (strain PCC 8305) TaxID=13035 RepID=K9YVL0_DACS8|nr:type IV pilus twitching motility protein PilT [Dactylococcopsis salina]AFZ50370.1 pilus retraction protein PilT [Dactylococcopsis salina PCC 8305]
MVKQSQTRPSMPPPPPPMPKNRQGDVSTKQYGEKSEVTQQTPSTAQNRMPPPPPPASSSPPSKRGISAVRKPSPSQGQPTLDQIVRKANDDGFSDIHLGVGEIPRFRNRGEMDYSDYPKTDHNTFMSWLYEVLTEEEIEKFQSNLEFDGATQYEFARVRINVFDTLNGPGMVLRLIPLKILTMEQLKLPSVFKDICHYHKGMILVTGPTGSGKSTTMAAMVDYINQEMPKHVITIEDPIEFVHQSKKSLIRQREVGMHTLQFDKALKASLREDPDIILIGEMRDRETVNTALKAAQTGHVVMGTLHTNSAVKTIERILSLYNPEEQPSMRVALAESLVSVISQGLCRTTDGKRAAFHDIMINTETVREYIRDGKYEEITELMLDGEFDGMMTMNKSLYNLYQEGRISEETALEWSPSPNEMAQMLRGRV